MGVVLLLSCGRPLKGRPAPAIDAEAAGRAAIAQYDANRDGKIEGGELDAVPALRSSLKFIDRNHDGAITADEITACIREWQAQKWVGRELTCIVTHNKKPLGDADVRFVPEAFLGPWGPLPCTGHTGPDGAAVMGREVPHGDNLLPVVPCGFYRVEIIKFGEKIPAKYNTATILGVGVLWNDPTLPPKVRFDLTY